MCSVTAKSILNKYIKKKKCQQIVALEHIIWSKHIYEVDWSRELDFTHSCHDVSALLRYTVCRTVYVFHSSYPWIPKCLTYEDSSTWVRKIHLSPILMLDSTADQKTNSQLIRTPEKQPKLRGVETATAPQAHRESGVTALHHSRL